MITATLDKGNMYEVNYYHQNGEKRSRYTTDLRAFVIGSQIELPQVRSAKVRNPQGLTMLISKMDNTFMRDRYAVRMMVHDKVKDIVYCDYETDIENMINIFGKGGYNYHLA